MELAASVCCLDSVLGSQSASAIEWARAVKNNNFNFTLRNLRHETSRNKEALHIRNPELDLSVNDSKSLVT